MSTGTRTASTWKTWEGQIIDGKFPLVRFIGDNRHSVTFLTQRPEGEPQAAAIKIVPADDATAEAQLRRWCASAELSHPHLIRLFEMGRSRLGDISFAYVLMEFAEEDLSEVDRPLTEAEARDMLEGTLKALAYLHGKQLAHGHLKTSNIGAVAEQLRISSDTIRPNGEWRGDLDVTEAYAPPEIEEEGASAAGDLWSLGMILVEALTKHPPSWEPGAVAPTLPDNLPARFRTPVLNCLHRDPRQRWTAADFATFLQSGETARGSQNASAHPRTATRSYLLAAGAVVLALAAVAIVPRLNSRRAEPAPPAVASGELNRETAVEKPASAVAPPEAVAPKSPGKAVRQDIVTQVLPDVPAKARNTIRGKVNVRIRVGVDASGSVREARNESPGVSRYFGNLALQAARRWKFAPADPSQSAPSRDWILRFQFVRDPGRPVSVQAAPSR